MTNDNEMKEQLIQRALIARRWSYSPYSHYAVGAALLTRSGKIYDGVNIENAAFPPTICAERVAVFKAVSEGERDFLRSSPWSPRTADHPAEAAGRCLRNSGWKPS